MTAFSDVLTIWKSLGKKVPDPSCGYQSVRVTTTDRIDMRAGINGATGQEFLEFRFLTLKKPPRCQLPQGVGFTVRMASDGVATELMIEKNSDGIFQLFSQMIAEVVNFLTEKKIIGDSDCCYSVIQRISDWQKFMRTAALGLSAEQELGLYGEIVCLNRLLDKGIELERALSWWQGPDHGIHDFMINQGSVEVKTTLATEGFPAKIFSIDQLDDSVMSPLFFYGIRLVVSDGGSKLEDLIAETRKRLVGSQEALERFNLLVTKSGFFDETAVRLTRRFKIGECLIWRVEKDFPRMTSQTVMSGVMAATYRIELGNRAPDYTDLKEVLEMLGEA